MAVTRTPFIAGNWKMNLDHLQAIAFVQKLAWALADAKHDFADAEVAVFPPFTDLRSVQTLVAADDLPIAYGAQDVSQHDSGAYTGEVSGAFLAKLDCRYVIIGHSERRTLHGETDAVVNAKVQAAHRHGIVPVLCVGETAEDLEQHGASAVPVTAMVASSIGIRRRVMCVRGRAAGAGFAAVRPRLLACPIDQASCQARTTRSCEAEVSEPAGASNAAEPSAVARSATVMPRLASFAWSTSMRKIFSRSP
jgi:hypothetical protein